MSTAFREPRTNLSTIKKTTMRINLEIDAADFGIIHLEASEVIRVSRRGRGQEPQISAQQSRELKNLRTKKNISVEILNAFFLSW